MIRVCELGLKCYSLSLQNVLVHLIYCACSVRAAFRRTRLIGGVSEKLCTSENGYVHNGAELCPSASLKWGHVHVTVLCDGGQDGPHTCNMRGLAASHEN